MYDHRETLNTSTGQALDSWSEDSIRRALRMHAPDLADLPLDLATPLGAPTGLFCRGSARLGPNLMLKSAWSDEAAARLLTQASLLQAIDQLPLPIQRPLLVTDQPVLVVYRRLPGTPLSSERAAILTPAQLARAGEALANVLAVLHSDATRSLVVGSGLHLPRASFWSQANAERLVRDLLPRLDRRRAGRLEAAIAWVEAVMARRAEGSHFVHGDFHGWNLLFDAALERVEGVLDFESAGFGDLEFDFRYLPGVVLTGDLFNAVLDFYPAVLDRDRALAWYLLMDLGDALWRTEQGAPVQFGPIEFRLDGALDRIHRLGATVRL